MEEINYPHCKNCTEYYYCHKHKLDLYQPQFLKIDKSCYGECAYDKKCLREPVMECPEYRQWCLEDLEVAKEQNYKEECYKE